jgi:hypothetical protein
MPEQNDGADDQGRKWETDQAGVKREIREGYTESKDMPGGIVIPSHKGNYGAQHGQEPSDRFTVHVDPHLNDDSIQLDTSKVTPAMAKAAARMTEDPLERNKILVDMINGTIEVPQAEAPATPRPQAAVPKVGKPVPKQPEGKKVKPEEFTTEAVKGLSPTELVELLTSLVEHGVDHPEATSPEEGKEQSDEIQPPRVQVGITSAAGESVSHYHHVIRSDMFLIMIYDTRFQFGSRYYPTPSEDKPYRVTVVEPEGEPDMFAAFYTGIKYTFGNYEHSIFLIDSGQPTGSA